MLNATNIVKKQFYLIVGLFFILSASTLHSQGDTLDWDFGVNASINFAGGTTPLATVGSAINSIGGSGNNTAPASPIKFYTDSAQVWDANNVQMPNGFGLFGNCLIKILVSKKYN